MKKQLPAFLSGVLVTTMVFGLGTAALAASGSVSFNASNLQFNGTQISAKGENYALDNGCQAPSSITYTDEKGGGTTYLPVRRIGELMGVETGWDGVTGSVTVKGTVKVPAVTPTTSPAPDTTISDDYSTWTAEEEAAYQEFKGMWEVSIPEGNGTIILDAKNKEETRNWWDANSRSGKEAYALRVVEEIKNNYSPDIPPRALFRISHADNLISISTYESEGIIRVWK